MAGWDAADAEAYAASYEGWGPSARYFHSRLYVVEEALRGHPGGTLLDAGCGPGMMVRRLLDTRPGDFRITASDRSKAMITQVEAGTTPADEVEVAVAQVEDIPFNDHSFDVVLAMGVLEYADAPNALREIARVTRTGGLVVVTMLNPLSPTGCSNGVPSGQHGGCWAGSNDWQACPRNAATAQHGRASARYLPRGCAQ